MKKILLCVSLLLLISVLFTLTAAAAPVKVECEAAAEQAGGSNVQDSVNASNGQIIGIKPDDPAIPAYSAYNIKIEADGKYKFDFTYSASTSDAARKNDAIIGDNRQIIPMEPTPDWDTFVVATVYFELKAGEYSLKISSPSDYDDTTVKTGNFDFFTYEKTEDLAPPPVVAPVAEEAAPENPPADTEAAPSENSSVDNPVTADMPSGLIFLALISAAAAAYFIKSAKTAIR